MDEKKSVFEELNQVNVNGNKDKKNGLDYLSWAWAWTEVKKRYPDSNSKVYENEQGWPYFTDGKTCWVKVGVTVQGLEHIEYLPVMDYSNNSIPVEKVTSVAVNKAIQRAITKAIARHGLALYIYAGEDLPEGEEATEAPKTVKKAAATTAAATFATPQTCPECGGPITEAEIGYSKKNFGKPMCRKCQAKVK